MSDYLLHLLEGTQLLQEAPPGCLLSLQPSLGADWLLQDPAEEIKDSDSNPIVCDKAVSADMAIKTGLLDLTSDSDTVAEVVLSHLCTFLKWRKHFRLITSTSPENVLSNFRCVHKL